jgi:thiamine biosynthesis lipoprotein
VKKLSTILLIWIVAGALAHGQILGDAAAAFKLSEETQRPVLLIFSGSDWCAPCIRFQKKVLSSEQFGEYAEGHLILLKADFPQRKNLSATLVKQNEQLAEKYNPRGQFPHLVLLRPDQSVITTLNYNHQQAEVFISQLSTHFSE